MRLLIRLIRIYTPFICTIVALVNGVLFLQEKAVDEFVFLSSAYAGNSIIVSAYFMCTSLRMCIWYKLNIICLLLTQLCGIAYNYLLLDFTAYLNTVVIFAIAGIIAFLIFRVFYKVTKELGCIRRGSQESL